MYLRASFVDGQAEKSPVLLLSRRTEAACSPLPRCLAFMTYAGVIQGERGRGLGDGRLPVRAAHLTPIPSPPAEQLLPNRSFSPAGGEGRARAIFRMIA